MAEHPASINATPRVNAKRKGRRRLRILIIAVGTVLALLAVSTITNLALERAERAATTPYGERVQISGGSINVYRSGGAGETIVLLSGLGGAAPAIEFAPLIRELDGYDVVVVEGFGYGYSDQTARARTVENITAELHEALSKLDIDGPYVLAGHSIAGYYTLYYANRYPEEVSAVIGIDTTIPTDEAGRTDPGDPAAGINWFGILRVIGLVRLATTIAPSLAEPGGDAYTAAERDLLRMMTNWNEGNDTVADETNRMAQNAYKIQGLRYPRELPVLNFLASGKATWSEELLKRNEDRLADVPNQKIVVLDGDHYLHYTHSREMAEEITDFLEEWVEPSQAG